MLSKDLRPLNRPAFGLFGLAVAALALTAPVGASTPEQIGLEIATEADRRDTGFGDYVVEDMKMVLRNRQGQESSRELQIKIFEVLDDGDKNLIVFDRPRDIKGTALLTFAHKVGDDDQWLYLPAVKRVKRISSSNKSGSFVGSEFAYEDLTSQEIEKYTYKYLRDESLDGLDCFVVERYPVYENSGYTRQVVWWDKAEYRVMKVDYYDRKGDLLKTLTYHGYQQYLDQYWRADKMVMVNHLTGKSTDLFWNNYVFRTGLSERDFNRNSLKRAK
ncbi:MAG: outer membrane lipoprotein-sorting protein [Alphaproteobacteria bacterium]|nr:outer membrane lipoprotein-sorting protein [Alphaproteobacteria bacterium]